MLCYGRMLTMGGWGGGGGWPGQCGPGTVRMEATMLIVQGSDGRASVQYSGDAEMQRKQRALSGPGP